MSDNTICIDDDCPLPEHEGACPEERTLEMWRTEAQRCRALIGQLIVRERALEKRVEDDREFITSWMLRIKHLRDRLAQIRAVVEAARMIQARYKEGQNFFLDDLFAALDGVEP